MTEITCCYKLECKRSTEYWVRRMDTSIYHDIPYRSNFWHPLCLKHLKKIIKNTKIEIIGLKTERVRRFEYKIFCSRLSHNSKFEKWKMFINWEEIAENLDLDKPITFEVYRALQKHHLNNYLKIKKRIERN